MQKNPRSWVASFHEFRTCGQEKGKVTDVFKHFHRANHIVFPIREAILLPYSHRTIDQVSSQPRHAVSLSRYSTPTRRYLMYGRLSA